MRALRVVGITGDGAVVLEDPGRRERYTVPADEQLRAAARGDVTRLGQIAIELESQLRPREIQARIRGGASVDQVAAAAGVPVQKIERFAYPVLLERSRTAELAQGAHPQRADGPDLRTLGETVAHTFGLRGQDYAEAGWDSWKGEDGKWVVALSWRAGRSDNAAHWAFQPGAHGGTVAALDEHASDLVEGLPARPLRTVGPVIDIGRDDEPEPERPYEPESPQMRAAAAGESRTADPRRGIAPEQRRSSPPPARSAPAGSPNGTTATSQTPADTRAPASDPAEDPRAHRPAAAHGFAEQDSVAQSRSAAAPSTHGSTTPDSTASGFATPDSTAPDSTGSGYAAAGAEGPRSSGRAPVEAQHRSTDTPAQPASTDQGRTDGAATAPATGSDAPSSGQARGSGPVGHSHSDRSAAATDDAYSASSAADADERRIPPGSDAPDTVDQATDGEADAAGPDEEGRARPSGSASRSASNRRTKKGKPVMPSWDEVLLGVRGQR